MPDVRYFTWLISVFVLLPMVSVISTSSLASVGEVRGLPFQIGVVTQFRANAEDVIPSLNKLTEAGINSIRDGVYWHEVEIAKDAYSVPSRMDSVINESLKRNITPLIVLSGRAPSFHGSGRPFFSKEKQEAYIKFAEHVVQKYKGKGIHYEIGNEWNINNGKYFRKIARYTVLMSYVDLLEKLSPRLKAIDESLKIVGPVMTGNGVDRGELEFMLSRGLLDFVDIISIHRYPAKGPVFNQRTSPEGLIDWLVTVENKLQQYSDNRPVPIFLSEVSWPTVNNALQRPEHQYTVSAAAQRDYLTRIYLLARQHDFIKGIWWFNLIDKNARNGDRYYGAKDAPAFGLMVRDTEANKTILKPSFLSLSYVSDIIKNSHTVSSLKNDCTFIQSMIFQGETQQVLVMWSPELLKKIKLNIDQSSVDRYDFIVQRAGETKFWLKETKFELELNSSPVAVYFPDFFDMRTIHLELDEPCLLSEQKK